MSPAIGRAREQAVPRGLMTKGPGTPDGTAVDTFRRCHSLFGAGMEGNDNHDGATLENFLATGAGGGNHLDNCAPPGGVTGCTG